MRYYLFKIIFILAFYSVPLSSHAQLFPLSENDWKNPEFIERYLGSYGMDAELSPDVNIFESSILSDLIPFIEDDVENGIYFLLPKITPKSSAALDYMLGQLYLENEQPDEAINSYNAAIKKFPTFLRAYKNIALAYMQNDNCAGAMPHLQKVLEMGKGEGLIYGIIGYCHLENENYSPSMSAYAMARIFEPEKKNWKLGHAQASLQAEKYQDAISILKELIRDEPGNASYLMLQANAFLAIGEEDDAISNLEMLNRLGLSTGASLTLLGDLYIRSEIPALALKSYLSALDANDRPNFQRMSRVIDFFANDESWQNATNYLNRLKAAYGAELDDREKIALTILEAQVSQGNKQFSTAAKLLNDAISKEPLNGKALLLLAQNYKNTGDYERAELYYNRAAAVNDVAYEALTDNARMAVSFRKLSRALNLLKKANILRPSSTIEKNIRILQNAINAGGN